MESDPKRNGTVLPAGQSPAPAAVAGEATATGADESEPGSEPAAADEAVGQEAAMGSADEAAAPTDEGVAPAQAGAEPGELAPASAPEPGQAAEASLGRATANAHFWLLLAAIVTVLVLLVVVFESKAYDPFACERDEQCRGLKRCIESHCVSPEVYERTHGHPAPP